MTPGQIQLRIWFGPKETLNEWPKLNGQFVVLAESYENNRYIPMKVIFFQFKKKKKKKLQHINIRAGVTFYFPQIHQSFQIKEEKKRSLKMNLKNLKDGFGMEIGILIQIYQILIFMVIKRASSLKFLKTKENNQLLDIVISFFFFFFFLLSFELNNY